MVLTLEDAEFLLTSWSKKHLLNSKDTSSQIHTNGSTYMLNTDSGKYLVRLGRWGLASSNIKASGSTRQETGRIFKAKDILETPESRHKMPAELSYHYPTRSIMLV